jgi:hypothetical protein
MKLSVHAKYGKVFLVTLEKNENQFVSKAAKRALKKI